MKYTVYAVQAVKKGFHLHLRKSFSKNIISRANVLFI